jgi:hypothetical protein
LCGFRYLWQRCRRRRQYTHRPQGDTTPSEPFEPSEPSEPGPRSGPTAATTFRPLRGGTMDAGQWCQSEFMAAAKRKPYNLASLVEMHPYSRCAGLPPEGEVLAALCFEMLMSSEAERRAKSPLRGEGGTEGTKRGAFPAGEARLYGFRCLWQRCRRQAAYIFIYCRDSGNPQPSEPTALSNFRTLRTFYSNPSTQPAAGRRPNPCAERRINPGPQSGPHNRKERRKS